MNGGTRAPAGTLTLAAAPIGRPQDASPALLKALAEAGVIAAEDTRRLRRLASALGVRLTGKLISYYEDVEAERAKSLLGRLAGGEDVLLITDAGMPGISDPGYRLVSAAAAAGIPVTVLPGPSAVTAALAVSGLPTDRFCFEGFPPRRAGERARRMAELAGERRTMVFFESPRRIAATLSELAEAFGADRKAVVCRELTKLHEEIVRGTLSELAAWAEGGVLGEITLVVAGSAGVVRQQAADPAAEVAAAELSGSSRSEAIAATAARLGLRKREVYDAVVRAKHADLSLIPPADMRFRPRLPYRRGSGNWKSVRVVALGLTTCHPHLVTSSPCRRGPTPTGHGTSDTSRASACRATCSPGTTGWRATRC